MKLLIKSVFTSIVFTMLLGVSYSQAGFFDDPFGTISGWVYGSEETGDTQQSPMMDFSFSNRTPGGPNVSLPENLSPVPVYIVGGKYKAVSIELNKEIVEPDFSPLVQAAFSRASTGLVGYTWPDLKEAEVRILFNGQKRGMIRLKNEKSAYALVDEIEGDNGRFYQVLIKVEPMRIDLGDLGALMGVKLGIDQVIMVR